MRRLAAARRDVDDRRHAGAGVARRGAGDARAARQRHAAAAHHRLRLLQSQSRRAGASGSPITCAQPARRSCRASGCGRCAPARWCWRPARTSGRWCSPTTTGRASCWPRACASIVNRYGVLPGRRAVIVTTGASAYHGGSSTWRSRRSRSRSSICGRDANAGRSCARPCAPGIEVLTGHTVLGTRGPRPRHAASSSPGSTTTGEPGARRTLACDCVGMSGGWTPAVHLFSQSRGKLAFDAALDAFVPGASAQAERSAGAAAAPIDLAACLADGLRRPAAAARRQRSAPREPRSASGRSRHAAAGWPQAGQGVRRFPERRHGQGHRARRARGLRVDRARQALHHHRHGDRPGQDLAT